MLVSVSHLLGSAGFWRAILQRRIPNMIDCACLSIVVYYDVGIWLEWTGAEFHEPYLSSMRTSSDFTFTVCSMVLLFMPWLLHLGGLVVGGGRPLISIERDLRELNHRMFFYLLAGAVTLVLAVIGAERITRGLQLWDLHKEMYELGMVVVLLYIPTHLLAYYIFQSDSRTKRGALFVVWLIVSGILSTLALGERTNTLMPLVIVILFGLAPRLKVIVPVVAVLIVAAALSLPLFKSGYAAGEKSPTDLLMLTLYNDFSRSGTLATSVELAQPIGTGILPYPGAGYVYSLLFFIPRSIVPWKGQATANWFTGQVSGSVPAEMDWAYGIGAAEELLLNFGITLVAPGRSLHRPDRPILSRGAIAGCSYTLGRDVCLWL